MSKTLYCPKCERTALEKRGGSLWCAECKRNVNRSRATKQPKGRTNTPERIEAREPSNRARIAADGGPVSVPGLGGARPAYLLAGSLVGFVVYRAISGGSDPVKRTGESEKRDDPAAIEATADGELYCPECDETCSPQGMIGHLRWGHDYSTEEMQEALPG